MKRMTWILSVALAVLAPRADAGVAVSGHACMDGYTDAYSYIEYSSKGAASTSGYSSLHVRCPAALDGEVAGSTARAITWARAAVLDNSTTLAVKCQVVAYSRTGAVYVSSSKETGLATTGYSTLSWTSAALNGGASIGEFGALTMNCYIPAASPGLKSSILGATFGDSIVIDTVVW